MKHFSKCILPVMFSISLITPYAVADHYHGGHGGHGGHWHGEIGHFHGHDFDRWHGGHWYHGAHGGHHGWWWIVGGTWYFYPAPVYPYPYPYYPPTVGVAPPPDAVAPPQYWYYCANPAGYYPYVPTCNVPWQQVAATPAQ